MEEETSVGLYHWAWRLLTPAVGDVQNVRINYENLIDNSTVSGQICNKILRCVQQVRENISHISSFDAAFIHLHFLAPEVWQISSPRQKKDEKVENFSPSRFNVN